MSRDHQRGGRSADSTGPDRSTAAEDGPLDRTAHEFEGESPHHHIALLYENQADQFAAVVPFVRDGLERGDRCIYVYDDNAEADVVDAMREAGIDVDAAVDAGRLSLWSKDDTFLRNGRFDPDEMAAYAAEVVREATEDDGYDAVRIAGEMTWVLDGDHSVDRMVEYERSLNDVFGERDVVGICQYNVARFDAEVINHVVRSHPSLVYGGAAGRHFYYLPPEELGEASGPEGDDGDPPVRTFLERVNAPERLERRERGLSALNDVTRELTYLDADEITARTPDIVRSVLDVAFASLWTYDEAAGELRLDGDAAASDDVTARADRLEGRAWETFVTERRTVLDERSLAADAEGTAIRSGVIVPLGRHGVICAGSTRPSAFDDATADLASTVGASVEAALDRADRERRLEAQNERLQRLERTNRVIRDIDEALVEAETRSEIEQIVCDRLAASDAYDLVWIGDRDVAAGTVEPRAQAGDQNGYVEGITVTLDETRTGRGPVSEALRSRETQVVQDVLTSPAFKPWREATLSQGLRGCISVPLAYGESVYGVLNIYSEATNSFDELEVEVLTQLGETIAHAVDAAETKRTLRSDSVTELTLAVRDSDDVLAVLARETGVDVELDGLVARGDGPDRLFFSTSDAPADEVVARAEELPGVTDAEVIREGTECAFEATVSVPTFAAALVDERAVVRSLTASDAVTAVVELPSSRSVREFVDAVRATSPTVNLVARRTRRRPIDTREDFLGAISERLTDRQREILETAFLSGFFESPRVRTGSDLADALDISQSTFAHHLREAERRIFEMVFENP